MAVNTYRSRSVLPNLGKHNYHVLMKTISNSQKVEVNKDIVELRLHCLKHLQKHGFACFHSAFPKISKSTIYRWQASYITSKNNPASLVPKSTRPKRVRQMQVDKRLVEFICAIRESDNFGFMGKDKIKPLLDAYAKQIGITGVSTGVIGKIIKRGHLSKNTHARRCKHVKMTKRGGVLRVKYSPKVKSPGYIEVDCITINLNGKNYYFVCFIDIFTRFALACYLSGLKAKLVTQKLIWFIQEYKRQAGIIIHSVQTDNGCEFLADFYDYCLTNNLKHIFTYPHHPQTNGYIERYNCSVQKEFLERSDELYTSRIKDFLPKLDRYNWWYNEVRPHSSLKNRTPIIFIKQYQSQMCVT